jgi:hypothetical protein
LLTSDGFVTFGCGRKRPRGAAIRSIGSSGGSIANAVNVREGALRRDQLLGERRTSSKRAIDV